MRARCVLCSVTFETLLRLNSARIMSTFYVFFYFRPAVSFALRYSHLFSKNSDTTDRNGQIITVGGVGVDFSPTIIEQLTIAR